MDWSWGTQLLLACGLVVALAGILWPKLNGEKHPDEPHIPPTTTTVIRQPNSRTGRGRYAEQVQRSYGALFQRWLKPPATPPAESNEKQADPRKAA